MNAHRGDTVVDPLVARLPETPLAAPAFGDRAAVVRPRARKSASRPVPQRDETFAHLTLDALRAYRKALADEEHKVSYWRRILQARLDVLRAGMVGGSARDIDTEALRPVLTHARVGAGRRALVEILPVDDIPPVPEIEQLWERQVDDGDADGVRSLEADLAQAERQLSDYRAALHRRIGDATGELIARYREQPSLCLRALPLPPERRAAVG
jgi:hypothetical protein